MKKMASWFTLSTKAALLTALFMLTNGNASSSVTVAHWTFSETNGPIVNTKPQADGKTPALHNGWVGYSTNIGDDNEVDRNGRRASFNGHRDSIILIDDENHSDFNPGDESLIVTVEFAVNQSALNDEALAPKETWNLIQKGRFNNSGGQWKMQIRKAPRGRLFLQCLINDNKPDTRREATQIPLKKTWITNSHILSGRCTLNRQANELKLELTDLTSGKSESPKTSTLPNDFGSIAPEAGECGTPESWGGNVSIGNKPLCPDQELDTDDAFQGEVFNARIERF